jgi:prevent-host-death family protein
MVRKLAVRNVNLVDAKAHLSKLVERAAAGDSVRITRHGEPVAQITAVQIPRKRIDVSAVRVMTDRTPVQQETARDQVGCWSRAKEGRKHARGGNAKLCVPARMGAVKAVKSGARTFAPKRGTASPPMT